MSDIRPDLGQILDSYERLTYKARTAIAEFVDNSTGSFFLNRKFLKNIDPNYKLKIDIIYEPKAKVVIVADNAMGMNRDELYDALKIANRPKDITGRNEFGMGLKTAASWFSKKWEIVTKRFDNESEYSVLVDINELKKTKLNDFNIKEKKVFNNKHYTYIRLHDVTRTIGTKMMAELKEDLASTYREDLTQGDIEIFFNSEKLSYEPLPVYVDKTDDINKEVKVLIDDYIEFNEEKLTIKGFVGILKDGSYKRAGLTLLRRNRVIIGGIGKNYKPMALYKNANSFASLRVFGSISLDEWPVTQAKDDFDWETNGLEELFISKIHQLTKNIFAFAQKPQRPDKPPEPISITEDNLQTFQEQTTEALNSIQNESFETLESENISLPNKTSYTLNVKIGVKKYNILVDFIEFEDNQLFISSYDSNSIDIKINTGLPLFREFNESVDLFSIVQKFIVLMVISESWIKETNSHPEGLVKPDEVREMLNKIIHQIEAKDGSYASF
jgi:hypothetical protein